MPNDRQRQDLQAAFIQHRDRLQEAAQRIVGTRDLAENVLQSAYLHISETAAHQIARQPISYCFQVVRHLAIDYSRRRMLEAQLFAGASDKQISPEVSTVSGEFVARVGDAMARLPPQTCQAFVLYRLKGLTQQDIAERLDVSPTRVDSMIEDAIEALKHLAG